MHQDSVSWKNWASKCLPLLPLKAILKLQIYSRLNSCWVNEHDEPHLTVKQTCFYLAKRNLPWAHSPGESQSTSWGCYCTLEFSHAKPCCIAELKPNNIATCWGYITQSTQALAATPRIDFIQLDSVLLYHTRACWKSAHTWTLRQKAIVILQYGVGKMASKCGNNLSTHRNPLFTGCIFYSLWFAKGKYNTVFFKGVFVTVKRKKITVCV